MLRYSVSHFRHLWNIPYREHSQVCLLVPDVLWWGSWLGKKGGNSWKSLLSAVLLPLIATCKENNVNWISGSPGKDAFADWLSAGGVDVKRRSESGEKDEKKVTFLYNFSMAWGTHVIKSYAFSQVCDSMKSCLHLNTDRWYFCAPAHCLLSCA